MWDANDIPHIMISSRGTYVPLHQLVQQEMTNEAVRKRRKLMAAVGAIAAGAIAALAILGLTGSVTGAISMGLVAGFIVLAINYFLD